MTAKRLKVTVTTEDGELMEQITLTSEGEEYSTLIRMGREVISRLEAHFDYDEEV